MSFCESMQGDKFKAGYCGAIKTACFDEQRIIKNNKHYFRKN